MLSNHIRILLLLPYKLSSFIFCSVSSMPRKRFFLPLKPPRRVPPKGNECREGSEAKHKQILFTGYLFPFLLLFLACSEEQVINPQPVDPNSFQNGVFITNEGSFNNGNASVSFYNFEKEELTENIFQTINERALGDVLQSMQFRDSEAYLVLNNSSKIEVVNRFSFESLRTIQDLTSPRYIEFISSEMAYVTDLFQNAISVVNTNSNMVTSKIPFSGWSEEMVRVGEEIFVTQPSLFNTKSSTQLFVINTVDNQVIDSVEVGFNPVSIEVDREGMLWVLCNGEIGTNNLGGIYRVNPSTRNVLTTIPFLDTNTSFAPRLALNGARDQIYFLKIHVFSLDIEANEFPQTPLIDAGGRDLYGLGIHPETGQIFVGDSGNFVQRGAVSIHQPDGAEIRSFIAGVGVNGFYFSNP